MIGLDSINLDVLSSYCCETVSDIFGHLGVNRGKGGEYFLSIRFAVLGLDDAVSKSLLGRWDNWGYIV
jgi:hypothetical protein